MRHRAARIVAATAALLLLLAGCGPRKEASVSARDLEVTDARIPAPAGPTAALYFTVLSHASASDRLEGVETDAAGTTMLHRTVREGDRISMEPVQGGLVVPAGGRLVLEPGGAHVMLMDLRRKLALGDRVPVTLRFEHAGKVGVEARVVSYADVESHGPAGGHGR